MTDLLVNSRVQASKGQRLRLRVVVSIARVLVDAGGGLDAVKHSIEDSGFADVVLTADTPPASWLPRAVVSPVTFPDWLLWVEATPLEDASIRADFVPSALITDAWTSDVVTPPRPSPKPSPGSPVNPTLVPASSGGLSPLGLLGLAAGTLGVLGLMAWAVSKALPAEDDEWEEVG